MHIAALDCDGVLHHATHDLHVHERVHEHHGSVRVHAKQREGVVHIDDHPDHAALRVKASGAPDDTPFAPDALFPYRILPHADARTAAPAGTRRVDPREVVDLHERLHPALVRSYERCQCGVGCHDGAAIYEPVRDHRVEGGDDARTLQIELRLP